MKLKLNWGSGIIIVFILFFISIFIRIYISYNQDLNLITPDYYPKGIEYQKQITKLQNTAQLKENVKIITKSENIVIQFPDFFNNKAVTGTVLFFRPSDDKKDLKYRLILDGQNKQIFYTTNFIKGKYILKLEWQTDGLAYYQEKDIKIE